MEERIKSLEVVSAIVERVENEINQLKIWIIKDQQNFTFNQVRIESVCSVGSEKDTGQNTSTNKNVNDESAKNITHLIVGNQPVILDNLLMSHLLGEGPLNPKRPSTTPNTNRPGTGSDSDDSDIQIIEDPSPREPSNKNAAAGDPEPNPQSHPDPPDEYILGDNFSFDIDEPEDSIIPISSLASFDATSSTKNTDSTNAKNLPNEEEVTELVPNQINIPPLMKKRKRRNKFHVNLIKQLKFEHTPDSEPSSSNQTPKKVDRPYKCEICLKRFISTAKLKLHHHIHEKEKYNCKYCPFISNTKPGVNSHVYRVHRDEFGRNLPFSCPQESCNLRFLTAQAAENHEKEKHFGLKCPFCEQKYFSKFGHRHHVEKIHKFCMNNACKRQFLSLNALLIHKKLHIHQRFS